MGSAMDGKEINKGHTFERKLLLLPLGFCLLLLSACYTQPRTKAMSTKETVEPAFRLIKLKDWNYGPTVWFPNSSHFAMLSEGGVEIYNTSLELIWSEPSADPLLPNSGIAISPDNKLVAVYNSQQGGIILLNALNGARVTKSKQDLCINLDAQFMLFGNNNVLLVGFQGESKNGNRPIQITSWSISPLQCTGVVVSEPVTLDLPTSIDAMFTSPDNKHLVTVSNFSNHDIYQGFIRVWDTGKYNQVCEIHGTYGAFRPTNGLLAVVGADDAKLAYWDVETCKLIENVNIPEYTRETGYTPQSMVFTPDGKYLVMCREGFQVLDASTGQLVAEKKMDIIGCSDFSISPDGKYILAAYAENSLITTLWQIDR